MKSLRINIITLGCSKNTVDSEVLSAQLQNSNITVTHNAGSTGCDILIINTCGFINDAKEESIETILQAIEARNRGEIEEVYVMGCLSERYKDELSHEIPEVGQYFGVNDLQSIVARISRRNSSLQYEPDLLHRRILSTPSHYAYLKIAEGCNRNCSFCVIPAIRGKFNSQPMEMLFDEARYLADKGVKELILIAQDLNYYGIDLYKEERLPQLVEKLCRIDEFWRIRLHYTYPNRFSSSLIDVIARNDNVCNYLDIPIQHVSDKMLKSMQRGYNKETVIQLMENLRSKIPDIALRTTLLVGHPGETEADFSELLQFVEKYTFDRLGVFAYSHEEGTYSYQNFDDEIPEEVKNSRVEEIMDVQRLISLEKNEQRVNHIYETIIDRREGDFYVGRTEFDSPEIDNEVLIPAKNNTCHIGSVYSVKIFKADEYELYGEVI